MHNTATETPYRQELKESILRVSTALFHRNGIRQVKMDDILEVMRHDKLEESSRMGEIDRHGQNVIKIVIEICKYRIEEFSRINPLFFEDIHKYPELLAQVRKLHEKRECDVRSFVLRGVDEGFFLPDVNYEIIRTLTNALTYPMKR